MTLCGAMQEQPIQSQTYDDASRWCVPAENIVSSQSGCDISESSESSIWSKFEFKLVCPSLPGARAVVISVEGCSDASTEANLRIGLEWLRINEALMIEAGKHVL